MKKKMRLWTGICVLLVTGALLLPARAGLRPAKVLITGENPTARLLSEEGRTLQDLVFDQRGQSAAGPLAPGRYAVRSGELEAAFTLKPNAALTQVTGDGWTDGEILHLGRETTGRLIIRYDGPWQWTLAGENADKAFPDFSGVEGDQCCTFERLPLGAYTLEGPEGNLPLLLTGAEPERVWICDAKKVLKLAHSDKSIYILHKFYK